MANQEINNYRVIAEGEIRLIREENKQPTFAFARIGNYEWNFTLDSDNDILIDVERINEDADNANERIDADFYEWSTEKGFQHIKNLICTNTKEDELFFTDKENGNKPYGDSGEYIRTKSMKVVIIIRISKQRSLFPDFTTKENHFRPITGVLKIGDQQFHINKEYLAWVSPTYFNSLFNGQFVEGSQEQVRLNGMDPDAFHEFLLVVNTHLRDEPVLPDVNTVAALLEFAQFFQIDFLKQLCGECLVFAREMPEEDRATLAQKYGLLRAVDLIIADVGDINKLRQIIQRSSKQIKAQSFL